MGRSASQAHDHQTRSLSELEAQVGHSVYAVLHFLLEHLFQDDHYGLNRKRSLETLFFLLPVVAVNGDLEYALMLER